MAKGQSSSDQVLQLMIAQQNAQATTALAHAISSTSNKTVTVDPIQSVAPTKVDPAQAPKAVAPTKLDPVKDAPIAVPYTPLDPSQAPGVVAPTMLTGTKQLPVSAYGSNSPYGPGGRPNPGAIGLTGVK